MNSALSIPGPDSLTWFKSSHSGSEGGACLEAAYTWHKSSYSGSEPGSECVEVGYPWHKSSHSGSAPGSNCVEVANCPATVHIRDSKVPQGPVLSLSPTAWASFTHYAANNGPSR